MMMTMQVEMDPIYFLRRKKIETCKFSSWSRRDDAADEIYRNIQRPLAHFNLDSQTALFSVVAVRIGYDFRQTRR